MNRKNQKTQWARITKLCKEKAKEVVGYKVRNLHHHETDVLKDLSKKQKDLHLRAESTKDDHKRRTLKAE